VAQKRLHWRDLCMVAAEERDSDKLASLVRQIIQAIDERNQSRQLRLSSESDVSGNINAAWLHPSQQNQD